MRAVDDLLQEGRPPPRSARHLHPRTFTPRLTIFCRKAVRRREVPGTFTQCPAPSPALQALAEQTAEDHGLRLAFALGEGWSPPPEDAGGVLYRVVRELLDNVIKHARAGRVRLRLDRTDDGIRIVLEDDGVGFDAGDAGDAGRSLGLFQVRERMGRLGGRFEIESAPGEGTRARLTLPLGERTARHRRDRKESP